jgi:hypothetical protein
MPRLRILLRCVGQAVCARGLKALVGVLPFGEVLYDVAADALDRLRREAGEEPQAVLREAAGAAGEEVKREAAAVAEEVAAGQPESVRQALAAYLIQVPASTRQSLKRPADPAGRTLPPGLGLDRPEDLLPFLPPRLPRYRPGDRPAGLGDWELVDLLGAGGFGEVWKARHAYFDGIAPVALKFCLDPAAHAGFFTGRKRRIAWWCRSTAAATTPSSARRPWTGIRSPCPGGRGGQSPFPTCKEARV